MNELLDKPEKYDPSALNLIRIPVKKFYSLIKVWIRNYRTRRHLKELPESLLDDVGLDRMRAKKESQRPFWD